jgi:hypothetical protein
MQIRTAVLLTSLMLSTAFAIPNVGSARAEDGVAHSLARCVDDSAIAIAHIDLSRVDLTSAVKQLRELAEAGTGVEPSTIDSLAGSAQALKAAGVQHVFAVFSPKPLGDRNPYYVATVEPGREPAAAVRQIAMKTTNPNRLFLVAANDKSFEMVASIGDAIVAGNRALIGRLQKQSPAPRPELEAAFAAAGAAPISLLLVPSADQRKAFEETLPELPQSIGGGQASVLTQGLVWAAVSYTPENQKIELVIQSQTAAAATTFRDYLRELPAKMGTLPWMKTLFPDGRLPDSLVPIVENDRLVLTMHRSDDRFAALENAIAEGGKAVRTSLWRTTRRNDLKQIALAMHNYHDVHRRFPAQANYDPKGGPLLSWRVLILEYVEEANLYHEFHLNEPWDSEHNKKLIGRIPHLYRSPEVPQKNFGKTTFLGVAGKHAFFHGAVGTSIREITDGTSTTLMVVETPPSQAVIWTKPDDFDVDSGILHDRLFQGRDVFGAAVCDGSAQLLSKAISEKTLHALFTINGGEIIPISGH